jgi:hypothetical protein
VTSPPGKLAGLQDSLAFVAIRDIAGHKYQQRSRDKADQSQHTEREGAAGEVIDLPAEGHHTDQAGESRKASGQKK